MTREQQAFIFSVYWGQKQILCDVALSTFIHSRDTSQIFLFQQVSWTLSGAETWIRWLQLEQELGQGPRCGPWRVQSGFTEE